MKQYATAAHALKTERTGESQARSAILEALEQKRAAEFFAGIGLMRLGLENDGWQVVFANDIAEEKLGMYAANFPDAAEHFLLDNIHRLDADAVPTAALATASFPCTDLSLAGARNGLAGKESSAFWGFLSIVRAQGERRPPIILLENVLGFLTSHQGDDLRAALSALNDLDYSVDIVAIDAERFVPQSRIRMFVIARRRFTTRPGPCREPSSFYQSDVRPKAVADFVFDNPQFDWDIRELPALPKRQTTLADILEHLPDTSPIWWSRERTEYLMNQMSERHRQKLDEMIRAKTVSYGTVFRRIRNGKSMAEMRTDGVAGCLRTPKGGSARQILVRAGRGKVHARLLTPRECARLMGADEFVIETTLNNALFGFGDAVCVPVVQWLSKNYLTPLANEIRDALDEKAG